MHPNCKQGSGQGDRGGGGGGGGGGGEAVKSNFLPPDIWTLLSDTELSTYSFSNIKMMLSNKKLIPDSPSDN